jgi:hypothetical protein
MLRAVANLERDRAAGPVALPDVHFGAHVGAFDESMSPEPEPEPA